MCPASGVTALVASLGDGNDPFATAVNVFPPRAPLPFTRFTLNLGAGSDSMPGLALAQPAAVEIDGGPDGDRTSIGARTQSLTLRGGKGNDALGAGASSGLALLDAGPGDDALGVKRDRDVDTLVCGTGLDHFSTKPGKGDLFGTDCPPVVAVAKEPGPIYLGGRVPVATQLIDISHPSTVNLILYRVRRGPDEVVARIKRASRRQAPAGSPCASPEKQSLASSA